MIAHEHDEVCAFAGVIDDRFTALVGDQHCGIDSGAYGVIELGELVHEVLAHLGCFRGSVVLGFGQGLVVRGADQMDDVDDDVSVAYQPERDLGGPPVGLGAVPRQQKVVQVQVAVPFLSSLGHTATTRRGQGRFWMISSTKCLNSGPLPFAPSSEAGSTSRS